MHVHVPSFLRLRLVAVAVLSAGLVVVPGQAAGADAQAAREPTQFACPPDVTSPFTDVAGSEHALAIACLFEYGIAFGTNDDTFSPDIGMTRAETVAFIINGAEVAGLPPLEAGPSPFADTVGNPYEQDIAAAAEIGVVRGTTPTTFEPDKVLTRGQLASMFVRIAIPEPPAEAPDAFGDDNGDVHEPAIDALAFLDIVEGVAPGLFAPYDPVTRGQVASIGARLIDYLVEIGEFPPLGVVDSFVAGMTAGAEVPPPGDPEAWGWAEVIVTTVPGVVCVFGESRDLSTPATAAHIHQAPPGEAGPPIWPVAVAPDGTVNGCSKAPPAMVEALRASPGDFYVNVHTEGAPSGAIRGQLGAATTELEANMDGASERPDPADPDGSGYAGVFGTSQPDTLCYFWGTTDIGPVMAAHIHEGGPEVAGPPVVPLPVTNDEGFDVFACLGGLDPAVVADILANPGDYYVNLHTDEYPAGAIRGQLQPFVGGEGVTPRAFARQ